MSNKIGIVTVLYKSENVLPEFFESLAKQTFRNFVLYVVDNLSPDNSLQVTYDYQETSNFPMVVIPNDDNYGVAKGNNIGIKQALADGCDYVLLSNNDVVVHEDAIELTLQGLLRNQADMAVPKIYFYKKNVLWYAGGGYSWHNGWCVHDNFQMIDSDQSNRECSVEYAPTCFMLIKQCVFETIGFMDEIYFVYWDDTDFVFRARKRGLKLHYIPSAVIEHNESNSTGGQNKFSVYYKYRNLVYFSLKNRNWIYAIYVVLFNICVHVFKHFIAWPFSLWIHALVAMKDGIKLHITKKNM